MGIFDKPDLQPPPTRYPGLAEYGKEMYVSPDDTAGQEDLRKKQERAALEKQAAALRSFTEDRKRDLMTENTPYFKAGTPESKIRYEEIRTLQPWQIAEMDRRDAEKAGNMKLAERLGKLRDHIFEQDKDSQDKGMRDVFDASRGTLASVATDVLIPVYRGFDSFARTASFGASELVKAGARKLAEAAGGASMENSEYAERALIDEAARTGFGKVAGGTADAIGMIKGFGGSSMSRGGAFGMFKGAEKMSHIGPMGAVEKLAGSWLAKGGGKQLTARLLDSSVGGFVAANAAVQLGDAGTAALNDLFYGESAMRPRAVEILKSMPQGALNSAILGGFTPVLQRIGRGVSSKLMGKWAPGVEIGQKLSGLSIGARAAQGVGGVFEFLGFAGMPHVSEDGFSVFQPYIDILSMDEKKRAHGWTEVLSQMLTGFALGASHGKHLGGKGQLPDKQFFLKDKPYLPREVETAIRSSVREGVDAMLKSADGDRAMMASFIAALKVREAMGYDKPGSSSLLTDPARNEFVKQKLEQAKKDEQDQRAIDEKRETDRYDAARPSELGFPQPGEGFASARSMEDHGRLPFMVDEHGRSSSPSTVESWDPTTRPDLADPGTKLSINFGLKGKKQAMWEGVEVVRPIFFKGDKRKGQLKGVLVRLDSTGRMAMFDAADVKAGLVKMQDGTSLERPTVEATGESSPREAAPAPKVIPPGQHEDAYGQRTFPFTKAAKAAKGKAGAKVPDLGVTEAARATERTPGVAEPSARPLAEAPRERPVGETAILTEATRGGEGRTDLSGKPVSLGEPQAAPAKKAASAEADADKAVADAEPRIQAAFPGISARKTKPKEGKLGQALRYAGAERRKEVIPAARARRSAESKRRTADRKANTDPMTELGNQNAWTESVKNLPGSGDVVALIDGTNTSSANKPEVGGHDNGDVVFKSYGARMREARAKSGADVALFRKSGGDEFAVKGKPAEVRKFLKALNESNKAGESKLADGKVYEHRLIAGEGKETIAEADKSQMAKHDVYRKQAEEAGLGLSRKKEDKPPTPPPAAEPANATKPKPGPLVPGLKRVELKKKPGDSRAAPGINLIPTKKNVASKATLPGIKVPESKVENTALTAEESIRGLYGEPHLTPAERETELRGIEEVLGKDVRDRVEHMLSMGESADAILADKAVRGAFNERRAIEKLIDDDLAEEAAAKAEVDDLNAALKINIPEPTNQGPAPVVKESPSSEATGKQAPPIRQIPPHEKIVEDEIRGVVGRLEELSGDAQTEAVQRMRDLKNLLSLVREKGQGKPYSVYGEKVKIPELGDHVTIKLDDGREVTGIVEESMKEPLGRRIKLLMEGGKVERVRLADMVDIQPADVLSHDFSTPTEVSLPTFMSWFSGRRRDTPGYERNLRLKRAFDKDQRARSVKRRRGLIEASKEYDADDAKGEMADRVLRARHDALTGDDYELEALARLVDPKDRNRVEANVTPEVGRRKVGDEFVGRDLLGIKKKDRIEGEAQRAPFHWFDPQAKRRSEKDLVEMSKRDTDEGRQAAVDVDEFQKLMDLANYTRQIEALEVENDALAKKLGRGFARVSGSLEELPNGATVYVRKQGIKDTHYGEPELLEVKMRDGRVVIRKLNNLEIRDAYDQDPTLRPEIQKFVDSRKKSFFERASDELKREIVLHAGAEGENAIDHIYEWAIGKAKDELPGGPLFDAARKWMRENNRPANEKSKEYLEWLRKLKAQIEPSESGSGRSSVEGVKRPANAESFDEAPSTGERTLFDQMKEDVLAGRDPVTGHPLRIGEDGGIENDVSPSASLLLPSVIPGMPPPGSVAHLKRLYRFGRGVWRKTGGIVNDIGGAFADTVADEATKIAFRPDKLKLASSAFGQTRLYKKWVEGARRFEAFASPSGDEYAAHVLTYLNRNAGLESGYIERMENAMAPLTKIERAELVKRMEKYTEGDKHGSLEDFDSFMREMYKEMKELELIPKDDEGRFLGQYIPYNKFRYTRDQLNQKEKDLQFDLKKAKRDGDKAGEEATLRAIENLKAIRTRGPDRDDAFRVVVSPVPLSQLGDPKTRALLNSGMLNHRSFKSWKEAVEAGLDTSNPIEMLREAMWTQMMAVTRHRLFRTLAADRDLVMDPKVDSRIPSWYVEPDTKMMSEHNSWRILDGKRVNPFLMDQLYQMDPKRNWPQKLVDYLHMSAKMSKALVNTSAIMTNLVGNPMILAMNGMPIPHAYASYAKATVQLALADPALRGFWHLFPGGREAVFAAEAGKYGSKRDEYMKEGWITHSSDATRELQTIFDKDASLREHILRGYSDHESLDQTETLLRTIAAVIDKAGAKGVRLYNMIDAGARAALHEHQLKNGMSHDESANEVNKSFDVQHLPKMWRGVRKGFASVGADSFVSFKVAMARNATKFVGRSPWVIANAAAMAYALRTAVGLMYGMDEDEMDELVDASTPRTGSWMFDKINRATSLVIPWGHHGPRTISMTRFTPHDAVLDLLPGVKVWAMGGLDDRGRTSDNTNAVTDFFSRSVLAGPYIDWYLTNRDPLTGAPLHPDGRFEGISDYVSEKIGFNVGGIPIVATPMFKSVMPFLNMVEQKRRMLNQMPGGTDPRYEARFPGLKKTDRGYETPGASAGRRGGMEALVQAVTGIRINEPNAVRRALESAQVGDVDMRRVRGAFRPTIGPGEPGRKGSREQANEANQLRLAVKGMELWAATLDLERTMKDPTENEDEIAAIRKKIATYFHNRRDIDDIVEALVYVKQPKAAYDIQNKLIRLRAYPKPEPSLNKSKSGTIPPFRTR